MWDPLKPCEMPEPDTPSLGTIRIRAAGNEFESVCVTLSNVAAIPLVLRVEPPLLFDEASGTTSAPTGSYVDRIIGPPVPAVAAEPL